MHSEEGLGKLVERLVGWNVYVCLNPARPHGIKPRSRDVYEFRQLLVDLDPILDGFAIWDAEQEAMSELIRLGVRPRGCAHVYSGRGVQLWVQFETQTFNDDIQRSALEQRCAAFLRAIKLSASCGVRVDPCTSDLPRLARLPGSVNQSTGQLARIKSKPGCRNKMELLWQQQVILPPERKRVCSDLTNLFPVLPHLTWRATEFLKLGVGEPGRHAACVAAARSLRDTGVPVHLATEWLNEGAGKCSPQLGEEDVKRIVEDTWRG